MNTMISTRAFLAAIVATTFLWTAGSVTAGCTPKREAATADIVTKKSLCALQNLDRTPEQMLIDCAIPRDAKDVQDIIDLFVGAQQSAVNAGAQLPRAQPGLKPHAPDAGH
jgi:hypothetical protein